MRNQYSNSTSVYRMYLNKFYIQLYRDQLKEKDLSKLKSSEQNAPEPAGSTFETSETINNNSADTEVLEERVRQ